MYHQIFTKTNSLGSMRYTSKFTSVGVVNAWPYIILIILSYCDVKILISVKKVGQYLVT